jgi:branched-chain amino acid transport system permease protein
MHQVIANAVIAACVYSLLALSFSLIYSASRFFHFAHGAVYVVGAYSALVAVGYLHWGVVPAAIVGLAVAALFGGLMDLLVYRPLRRRQASSLVLLIASLGLYVVLQNAISAIFGDETQTIRTWPVRGGLPILGARITPVQILIIVVAIALFTGTILVLKYTKAGIAMRALACNAELARVVGMDTDRVILYAFLIGSALVGAAGVLISLDVDMTPTMGLNALLMGVVAAIVGGIGSIPGAAVGALILAFAQQFGVLRIPSQWQDAIAFGVLLVFLLVRPAGVLGRRAGKVRV